MVPERRRIIRRALIRQGVACGARPWPDDERTGDADSTSCRRAVRRARRLEHRPSSSPPSSPGQRSASISAANSRRVAAAAGRAIRHTGGKSGPIIATKTTHGPLTGCLQLVGHPPSPPCSIRRPLLHSETVCAKIAVVGTTVSACPRRHAPRRRAARPPRRGIGGRIRHPASRVGSDLVHLTADPDTGWARRVSW
jgi:hypothetical protein